MPGPGSLGRRETKPADLGIGSTVLRNHGGIPGGGTVLGDPFVVDFVSLAAMLRRDHLVFRKLQPEEIKDPNRDPDHVSDQLLVANDMRSDVEGGEPVPPCGVVPIDQLDKSMDLIKVEVGFVCAGVSVMPVASLLGARPRHSLGNGVLSIKVNEAGTTKVPGQQLEIGASEISAHVLRFATTSSIVPHMTLAPKRPFSVLPSLTAACT